jgi:hypothetical protein
MIPTAGMMCRLEHNVPTQQWLQSCIDDCVAVGIDVEAIADARDCIKQYTQSSLAQMRADVLMAIESCDSERMGRVIWVARSLGHCSTPEIQELVERFSSPLRSCPSLCWLRIAIPLCLSARSRLCVRCRVETERGAADANLIRK